MDTTAVVAIITLAGSLLIAAFTQRSAKSDKVIPEYASLTKDLRAQVTLQGQQIKELQDNEEKRRRRDARRAQLQHVHEVWDRQAQYEWAALAPHSVPDPPPLDVWD